MDHWFYRSRAIQVIGSIKNTKKSISSIQKSLGSKALTLGTKEKIVNGYHWRLDEKNIRDCADIKKHWHKPSSEKVKIPEIQKSYVNDSIRKITKVKNNFWWLKL